MLDRVLKTISRYNMLPEGSRVIVAVSGGADSVCLLHVLKELAPEAVVGVAHFNHKWRAEASDEDECFVAGLASRFGLPVFKAEAVASKGNREQEARRARRRFFAGLGATVALGHTRDDQAETVLFRFLRGSGLAGLAGIPPAARGIIRPLIDVTRAEVEQHLRSRGIPWREDASNLDPAFARNRIRHDLLPQLTRNWNPNLTETLARLADLANEEEKYWDAELESCHMGFASARMLTHGGSESARDSVRSVELRHEILTTLPRAKARRLIRHAIAKVKGDLRRIEFNHVEAVFEAGRTLHLPGVTVTRSLDWLQFALPQAQPKPEMREIDPPGIYPSPDGLSQICIDTTQIAPETLSDPCATLKVEACWFQRRSPLVLRGWRPGDHYRPIGKSRDQKIQEMFQKARVPSWRRASWPILTGGEKILWSRQFGVAHELAAPGEGCAVLRIRELN